MARSCQWFLSKFKILVLTLVFVQCSDAKLDIVNSYLFPFNIEQFKLDLFFKNDLAQNDKLSSSNPKNWTEHRQCLLELNAIKNGLMNFEPWAITCKSNIFNYLFYSLSFEFIEFQFYFSIGCMGKNSIWHFKWKFYGIRRIFTVLQYQSKWPSV